MMIRGVVALGVVVSACGGTPPPARTCDELARHWQHDPVYASEGPGDERDAARAECREEHWAPAQIACVDRGGVDATNPCLGRMPRQVVALSDDCSMIRRAALSAPSRFESHVGEHVADDEASGMSYYRTDLHIPGMDCAIKDEPATETTMVVCDRFLDASEADDEYQRLRGEIAACIDTWPSEESEADSDTYTVWSEAPELDATRVVLTVGPHEGDDAGGTLIRLFMVNRVTAP